ncbi:MAG: ABC transporter permease [Candidatus Moranbacteria bacterium]|nr:ABC transporter permease [Candidatus Moranbacteria bacterium]MDD3965019.1 ABC transporter permease [Candidatus Moranbacteria bacterium]
MRYLLLVIIFVLRDFSKARAIFTMVVISLAIASTSVLATNSILAGFQEMLSKGVKGWIGDIFIIPTEEKPSIDHAEDIISDIKTLQYVEAVSVRASADGTFKYKDKISAPFSLIGVDTGAEAYTTGLPSTVIQGQFLDITMDSESIILGLNFADSFIGGPYDGSSLSVGEKLQFIRNDGSVKEYRIKGIIDGKNFLANFSAMLQKDEVERISVERRNSSIVVKVSEEEKIESVKKTIAERHPDVIVHNWIEESGYVEGIMQTVYYITFLISSLLIFSVFFIIAIVIFINISQKKRQIGIMKSMGATTRFIVSIYVLESVLYFVFSYLLGILLFLVIHSYSVSHSVPLLIGDFHTVLDWQKNILYFFILLLSAFLGGLIPSFFASKQKIIDTLRST